MTKLYDSLQLSEQMIEDNAGKHIGLLEEIKVEHIAEIAKVSLDSWGKFFIGLSIGAGAGAVVIIIISLIK